MAFKDDFPEFVNTPDSQVSFWLGIASQLVVAEAWGDLVVHGRELFAAHNIAIQTRNINAANFGGEPGFGTGAETSKSVGPVSVSYDQSIGSSLDAGHWNLTVYGRQFVYLARLVGNAYNPVKNQAWQST